MKVFVWFSRIKAANHNYLFLFSVKIGEGFDCPSLSNLFLTTPITFEGRLIQVLGRIMRPAKGKKAMVYDYVDEAVSVLKRSADGRKKILNSF